MKRSNFLNYTFKIDLQGSTNNLETKKEMNDEGFDFNQWFLIEFLAPMVPKEGVNHLVDNRSKRPFNGLYVQCVDNFKYKLGEGIRYKNTQKYENMCIGSYLLSCRTTIYKYELKPWKTQQMFKKIIDVVRK